jgi:hypothetical protein
MTLNKYDEIYDAKLWEKAKTKKYILCVFEEDAEDPIPLLKIVGHNPEDIIARLGSYERKMEKVLANHIEA